MPTSRKRIVEAMNLLITSPKYATLINEITSIIERWDTHPMAYSGKLSCLNALVDVGLQSRDAFEKLIKLIEDKRRLIPEAKRVDYQRELMRDRRARLAKALELHEAKSGPLVGAARKKAATDIQGRWKVARDRFIADKGNLSWKQRNDAAQEFWEGIDRQLNANLAAAQARRLRKPA